MNNWSSTLAKYGNHSNNSFSTGMSKIHVIAEYEQFSPFDKIHTIWLKVAEGQGSRSFTFGIN